VRAVLNQGRGLNTITESELFSIYNENPSLFRWALTSPGGKEMLNWERRFPVWAQRFAAGTLPPPGGPPLGPGPAPGGPPAGGPPAGGPPVTVAQPAPARGPIEQHLISRLEEEKKIKETISENKDKFRKAKTARARVLLQKQIKEKQEGLKTVRANIKLLQKAYKQEFAEEKLKEKAKPEKPILLKDIGDLKQLDQAAEKIESENAFILSKLAARKKISKLTEKEQEAYKQYKETYDSAVKERESIKEKLGSARAFARATSRRLRNIASQERKLGKDKKDSLVKGDLSKSMNIEGALIMLREEKEKEIKKYEQTADEALEYIKSAKEQDEILLKDAQTEIDKLSENRLIKEIEGQMGRAKEKKSKTAMADLKKRHPSVFEEIPKIKKKYKNSTKQALAREELRLDMLKGERIRVIGTANSKKIEQANNKVEKQIERIDNLKESLTGLKGEVQSVLSQVKIEEREGRTTAPTSSSTRPPSRPSSPTPPPPPAPPSPSSPGASVQKEMSKAIIGSSSFENLYKTIRDLGEIQGTKRSYSAKELEEKIEDVRAGRASIVSITRTGGLRRKVLQLLKQEQEKKGGI